MKTPAVLVLAGKELRSWFCAPLFYGLGIFFPLFLSLWLYYFRAFFAMDNASLRPFFEAFPFVYIPVIPALTMKSWAEEKKQGTLELLAVLPVTEWELCLGKFLSSVTVLLIFTALTLPVPLTILPLAHFDAGVIITEYVGAVLLGVCAAGMGLFFSGLSKNQASAFLSCVAALLVFMFADRLALTIAVPAALSRLLRFFSLSFHFESFSRGILDTRDVGFFIITTFLFLFLNTRSLVFRKWS